MRKRTNFEREADKADEKRMESDRVDGGFSISLAQCRGSESTVKSSSRDDAVIEETCDREAILHPWGWADG